MKPVQRLAWVGSDCIIWQSSAENTSYKMVKAQTVRQVQRSDDFVELDYTILCDTVSQETIPGQMQALCHSQYGTKVKHNSRLPKKAQLGETRTLIQDEVSVCLLVVCMSVSMLSSPRGQTNP